MRSLRAQKVLRDLWLHRSRSGLVVAAICIGITGAGSVLDAWALVRRAMREGFDASKPHSAVIRTDSVDESLLERVRAIPGIESAESRLTVPGRVKTPTGTHAAFLATRGDYARSDIGRIAPGSGAWPPRDNELVVESSSVEFGGVAVGDDLMLAVGDSGERTMRVTGIARDVGVPPGWMEHVVYVFVTPETLAQLGAPTTMNELLIRAGDRTLDRAGVTALATRARGVIESSGRSVTNIDVPIPGRHQHAGQIDSLLLTQGAFAFLTLILSGLLVVNLISAMLTGQVREIGIMKAIGGSASQISAMYLGLAAGLGVLACVISIPFAALIGRMYAGFTGELLNFDVSGYAIPRWSFMLQAAVGMILPLVAASIPIRRGCRIPVGEALRDLGISGSAGDHTHTFLDRFDGITRPILLSLRNAFRRRQRMILTLVTLTTGGAIYLGALNLRESVTGAVDLLFEPQHFDVSFRLAHRYPPDSIAAAFQGIDGLLGVEAWGGARAQMINPDGRTGNAFTITAPPADTKLLSIPIILGRALSSPMANELVVNRRMVMDDSGFAVGSVLQLRVNGQLEKWTVVGLTSGAPSPQAFTSRETLARIAGTDVAATAIVATSAETAAERLAVIRRVRDVLPERGVEVASSSSMEEQRAVIEDHLLMVAGFLGNMSLLMIVVGGLGLASTMSLAVLERTREIGVLRAIGAEHTTILAMIQVEGLVMAILSWLLAIPLSIPMSLILGAMFSRVMLPVPTHLLPYASGVLQWLGVAVLVSLAACAWPALRATRITTSAALAYE